MIEIPSQDDLDDNEVAIRITDDRVDDLGRAQFTAFWRDHHMTPAGVRGQVFNTTVADWVQRETQFGFKVTALDEHTHRLLDSLGLDGK
jgi:hypothetical protein